MFEYFILALLIFIAGYAVGWAMCNSTWVDHSDYGWQRRIGNYNYVIKKVEKRVRV